MLVAVVAVNHEKIEQIGELNDAIAIQIALARVVHHIDLATAVVNQRFRVVVDGFWNGAL